MRHSTESKSKAWENEKSRTITKQKKKKDDLKGNKELPIVMAPFSWLVVLSLCA
jgi:hypothetical protein